MADAGTAKGTNIFQRRPEAPAGFCPKTMPVLYTLCEIIRCGGSFRARGSDKDYEIDFRFYGFECGNEFNQEVIIENGKLKADNKITYDDYFWECPFPNLGG